MNYSQDDACIIHLSDLHIVSNRESQPWLTRTLSKLVEDIKGLAVHMKECIIVVSGDITNRGDYSSVTSETIMLFFREMKSALDSADVKVKEIIFCPGNHDVKYSDVEYPARNYDLILNYMANGKVHSEETSLWSSYTGYFTTVNNVRNLFGFSPIKRSFNCLSAEVNSFTAAFVVMDLAWNYLDPKLRQKTKSSPKPQKPLLIGKFQSSELLREFRNASTNEPDVVIFVCHYPLIYIDYMEQHGLLNRMLSKEDYGADLYLCGHIHEVDTINYSTHEHSILSLVTGIGWPQSTGSSKQLERRYSIYEINPIRNSCSIVMRRGVNTDFNYDYTVYTNKEERSTKKITYPLRIPQKNLPYLSMKASSEFDKDYFISSEMSSVIQRISACMAKINFAISSSLNQKKEDMLYLTLEDKDTKVIEKIFKERGYGYSAPDIRVLFEEHLYGDSREGDSSWEKLIDERWLKYCNERSEERRKAFISYLVDICDAYVNNMREIFSKDTVVRPHFREYERSTDSYPCLCFYPPVEVRRPKEVKWGGLIKAAYHNKTPLIYSANIEKNDTQTDWQEFITLIPEFPSYEVNFPWKSDSSKYHKRPKLSFGISVKNCSDEELQNVSRVLAVFNYLEIQSDMSKMISRFIACFGYATNKGEMSIW